MNSDFFIKLTMAFTGSFGFALIFHIRKRLILAGSIGGLLSYGVLYLSGLLIDNVIVTAFLATAFVAVYTEILARVLKTPSTVLFMAALIPLFPGSTLYYTMSYGVAKEWETFEYYGSLTAQYVLGIAAGMSAVWAVCNMIRKIRLAIDERKLNINA